MTPRWLLGCPRALAVPPRLSLAGLLALGTGPLCKDISAQEGARSTRGPAGTHRDPGGATKEWEHLERARDLDGGRGVKATPGGTPQKLHPKTRGGNGARGETPASLEETGHPQTPGGGSVGESRAGEAPRRALRRWEGCLESPGVPAGDGAGGVEGSGVSPIWVSSWGRGCRRKLWLHPRAVPVPRRVPAVPSRGGTGGTGGSASPGSSRSRGRPGGTRFIRHPMKLRAFSPPGHGLTSSGPSAPRRRRRAPHGGTGELRGSRREPRLQGRDGGGDRNGRAGDKGGSSREPGGRGAGTLWGHQLLLLDSGVWASLRAQERTRGWSVLGAGGDGAARVVAAGDRGVVAPSSVPE